MNLKKILKKWRAKHQTEALLRSGFWSVSLGAFFVFFVSLFYHLIAIKPSPVLYAGVFFGVSFLTFWIGYFAFFKYTLKETVTRVDNTGLEERIGTMYQYQNETTPATLLSFSLRTLGVSLLVLLLSGMHFVFPQNRQSLMIVMDFSQSTKGIHADVLSTARSLFDLTEDQNEVGALAFGYNRVYAVELSASNRITVTETPLSDVTDLASAIAYAEDLMPDGKGKRIILLTDGKETDGDALSLAEQLGHLGVRIDAVYYNTATLLA